MDQSQPQSDRPRGAGSAHPLDERIVKVARVVVATRQQAEQLHDAVAALASQQQHIDALAADLKSQIGELSTRLGAAGGPGGGGGSLHDLGSRIEKLGRRIELASSKIDEQVFALKGRVTGFADGVEQWFKPARSEIEANRAFVERAAEQIKGKLQGFERAAQDLQSCIADLQRSHELRDASLGVLSAKLDECLGRLDHNADHLADAVRTRFDEKLGGLREQLTEMLSAAADDRRDAEERVAARIAGIQEGMEAWSRHTEEDARHRTELSWEQKELGAALSRLEEKIEAALETYGARTAERGEEAAAAEVVSQGIREVQQQLNTISRQLDDRVARSLGEIRAQHQQAHDEAAARRKELTAGQKELGMAMLRLQSRVTESIAGLAEHQGRHGEQGGGPTGELGDLRDQLASLGDQLGVTTAEIDNRITASLADVERSTREAIKAEVAAAQRELGGTMRNLEQQIEQASSMAQSSSGRQIEGIERRLATLSVHLDDISTRLWEQGTTVAAMSPEQELADLRSSFETVAAQLLQAVTDLGRVPSREREQLTAVERQLDDLRDHMTTIGERIEAVTGDLDTRMSEMGAGAPGNPTELHGQTAELEQRLDELAASVAQIGTGLKELASMPRRLEERVTEAITKLSRKPSREQEQLTGVERQLDDLREHIAALSDRLAGVTAPEMPGGSAGAPAESAVRISATLEQGMATLRDKLEAVSRHVDSRVSEVTDAIGEVAVREPDGDMARQLEEHLDAMQAQLTQLGTRFGTLESSLAELETRTSGRSGADQATDAVERARTIEPGTDPATERADEPAVREPGADASRMDGGPATADRHAKADEPPAGRGLLRGRRLLKRRRKSADHGLEDEAAASGAVHEPEPASPPDDDVAPVDEPAVADEPAAAAAADPAAERPAIEQMIETMITAINSGDARQIRRFIAEQYSLSALAEGDMESRVEVFMGVQEEAGEMHVVDWEVGEEGTIIVILQTRRSLDRMRFEILREPDAPHKITQVNMDWV